MLDKKQTIKSFLKVKVYMSVCVCAHSSLTLCNSMDCSPHDPSVHGVLQARILECIAISYSRGSSHGRDQTCISCIGRRIVYHLSHLGSPNICIYNCLKRNFRKHSLKKNWYIYTMEYYSAIKKNSFESVLMRWMKLESIIQSEVSQKDKDHYSILTHIYGI